MSTNNYEWRKAMKTATIKKVYEIGTHNYNGQGETAVRALLSTGRRCWLVGYGSDLLPASTADVGNITGIKSVPGIDDGSEAYEIASWHIDKYVRAYR
jgi:hypothetical protein